MRLSLGVQLRWLSTALELLFVLALFSFTSSADNCTTPPLVFGITNVTLSDGVAKNRGVKVVLGGQPEGLRVTFMLNNTRVRNAYDCKLSPNATEQATCLGASGGTYDLTLHTFNQTGHFNVSHTDAPPVDATVRQGTDTAEFGNWTCPAFPFEVWSANATNKSGIAFGPSSSVLQRILDFNAAPSRFMGLFFGSRSESLPLDGELVVGGYNGARVNGTFTNFSIASQGLEIPCPLQVQIKDMVLSNANGTFSLVNDNRSTIAACIDPLQNQFALSQSMYDRWARYTSHNASDSNQIFPPGHQPYMGNLTVVLAGEYTTFIPNYELLSDERGTNAEGKYDVISNNVMAAVGPGLPNYGDIPILGGTFLSQNYLFVDYDHGVFGLAPVVLGPMDPGKSDIKTVCTSGTAKGSGGSKHVGVIVGPVVGGVFALALIGLAVWWVLPGRKSKAGPVEDAVAENDEDWRPADQKGK